MGPLSPRGPSGSARDAAARPPLGTLRWPRAAVAAPARPWVSCSWRSSVLHLRSSSLARAPSASPQCAPDLSEASRSPRGTLWTRWRCPRTERAGRSPGEGGAQPIEPRQPGAERGRGGASSRGGRATPKLPGQRRGSHAGRRCGDGRGLGRGLGLGYWFWAQGDLGGPTPVRTATVWSDSGRGGKRIRGTQEGPRTFRTRSGKECSVASVDRRTRSAQGQGT